MAAPPDMPESAIETRGLTKRFGSRAALQGADLDVPRGCAFGFLGPNGAGKTTLIRVLLGLTPASAGSMRLLGVPVPARRGEALAKVGAIVEEPRFQGHLTGRENLRIAAACREPAADGRIAGALERMGLIDRADDRVRTYSMGMRQRLGIARCLLADPELLILDEPTNGLDPAGILEFRTFVRSLVDEGRTVFLSSHLMSEIAQTADHLVVIGRGRLIADTSVDDVVAQASLGTGVRVRSPQADALQSVLAGPGVTTQHADPGVLMVFGLTSEQIGEAAAHGGLVLHELTPQQATLEEAFMALTEDSVEYHAATRELEDVA
jgi:ABC-2 type transport system ATP-binding protein